MSWAKWIVGGLGFSLFGPIGAVIGFYIGSLLEGRTEGKAERNATSGDFLISFMVLLSSVMKADKKVLRSELNVVKSFLVKMYGVERAKDALHVLKDLLERDYDVKPVAEQIAEKMTYSSRLELLHLMFEVAVADNDLAEAEIRLIKEISASMGVADADYESIFSMFNKQSDKTWAYKVLEIDKSATDDEVKKAYRRMAMKYHPDKVNNMGEEVKKTATEKFRKVNEAYEAIKKERGIS